jgi:hypothetical protein
MAIPVWPNINYMVEQGTGSLTLSDGKGRVVSNMDNGAQRYRRRFTKTISPLTETMLFDYNELSVFEFFYRNVLKDGTLWFYKPIQRGREYIVNLVRFAPDSAPATTEAGYNKVNVPLNLQVYETSLIPQSVYDYFATAGFEAGGRLSEVVTKYVNEDYPEITAEYR